MSQYLGNRRTLVRASLIFGRNENAIRSKQRDCKVGAIFVLLRFMRQQKEILLCQRLRYSPVLLRRALAFMSRSGHAVAERTSRRIRRAASHCLPRTYPVEAG